MSQLVHELATTYKVDVPLLFSGTFDEARHAAHELNRYLILYLHCPTHEDTAWFVKDVLAHSDVHAALRDCAVVFGLSVMHREGHCMALELGAQTYPFIAVLYKRSVAMRMQGACSRRQFLTEWRTCTDTWDGDVAEETALRCERATREAARLAREQDAAQREEADRLRLAQHQERERAREQALERARAAEAEARARAQREVHESELREAAAAARARTRDMLRAQARAQLPCEPAADVGSDRVVHINVRCASGCQYQRRFWRTDRVDSLLDFVHTLDEYDGADVVQLLTGVPPKPLRWQEGVTTFADVPALCPRAAVLMRTA